MDAYISAQYELLEQIKRTHSNFKKLPKDRLNINYINTKLQLLDQSWSNIQENHMKLLRSYDKKVLATTNYVADDIYFTAEEEYTITKVTMLDKLQNITPQIQNQTMDKTLNSSTATPVDIKIPIIKIPTFNGNYTEWHSFHDQFVSLIHDNIFRRYSIKSSEHWTSQIKYTTKSSKTESRKYICTYYNGDHFIHKCKQFIALSCEDKKKVIEEKQLCFNCLDPYHGVKICKHDAQCHICGKKHHSLILPPPKSIDEINTACVRNSEETSVEEIQNTESIFNDGQDIITHLAMEKRQNILLSTALVKVLAENGRIQQLRALIDQGSEGSFITESAAQALGVKRKTVNGSISGIGDSKIFKVKHKVW
ncbi:unnamed protein product [Parnassius mnemosyne]|uniref:Peptidase A2 domain-containing protein n=1 Tax=Parnassius mnemosyne TaxID=213953 RepID=A0AAV1MBX6_9NEOP